MTSTLAEPRHRRERSYAGARARRPRWRRAAGLGGTIGLSLLGALLPGAGMIYAGRKALGFAILLPTLGLGVWAAWYAYGDLEAVLSFVFDPARLRVAAGVLAAAFLVWLTVVLLTYRMVRARDLPRWKLYVGRAFVTVLCISVAAPMALMVRYSTVQADLVQTLFENNESATAPKNVTAENPWAGHDRVNVLLLGGDGGVDRVGIRTDTMILVSIDTSTGKTVMVSLPRNLEKVPFPAGSPLAALYPEGYDGEGDYGQWILNALYGTVPVLHPNVLGEKSDNEGADALKLAIEGATGQQVDYYVLVNLDGFQQIVEAMGGVTVNINEPVPIGGNSELGVAPDDYLDPGPNQRLNGFEALWFSRGRYGSDDYQRMDRQRCMMDAIIDEAKPLNLLRRYQSLAEVGKEIIRTDIPSRLLPAFVDLALKVKDAEVKSLVFKPSEKFNSADPDFDWMREVVRKAIDPPPKPAGPRTPGNSPSSPDPSDGASPGTEEPGAATSVEDSCAYNPETAVE